MWTIILRSIKDSRRSLLIYCFAVLAFTLMYISLFPSISAQAAKMQEVMANYPKEIFKAFGVDSAQLALNDLHQFLSLENFSILIPMLLIALGISSASGALAGEIERGTIVLLLSQPISRLRLFFAKYISGALKLTIVSAVAVLAPIVLAAAYNLDFKASHFFSVLPACIFFGLSVFSVDFLFSSMFSEKGKATFITLGIVVLMYAVNILSALQETVQNLRYISFFYYFDHGPALVTGQIYWWHVLALGAVAAVCTILGAAIFSKRDISA